MTVRSLWDNAGMKENLIFSLVSEDPIEYDFSFIPKEQLFYQHFQLNKDDLIYRGGLAWSRDLSRHVTEDYDYFLQLDSHTIATQDWDIKALSAYESLSNDYDKFIISGHPADYDYNKDGSINFYKFPLTPTYARDLSGVIPGFTFPKYYTVPLGEHRESYFITGCYIFAPKLWIDEVEYDKNWSANVEEFLVTLKSFDKGWKTISYGQRHLFHHFSHQMPDGTITRERFRPWADKRADQYWKQVYEQTDRLSSFLSEPQDGVSHWGLYNFFDVFKLDPKYSVYIENYHNHVEIPRRALGMPPKPKVW
jgi:hypothetical protein